MYGLKEDWELEPKTRQFVLDDYVGNTPRWCSGGKGGARSTKNTQLARWRPVLATRWKQAFWSSSRPRVSRRSSAER